MNEIQHTDHTSTQGFERPGDNTITVFPGDCPHCLLPFNRKSQPSWRIKVWTDEGFDEWCATCAEEGVRQGVCIKYRSLDKKQRKELKRYAKHKSRQTQ